MDWLLFIYCILQLRCLAKEIAIIFVIAAVGLLIFSFVILKRCADEEKKLTEKKDEVEETEKIL